MTAYWETATATVWTVTHDKFGQPTFASPVVQDVAWIDGGDTQRDDDGNEFTPDQRFFSLTPFVRGSYIAVGDQSGTQDPQQAKAKIIRKVKAYDMSQFNEPTEYEAMT